MFFSFIEFLNSSMPRGEGDDNLTWKLTKTGLFDVHSYYKLLSSPLTEIFPWECIWFYQELFEETELGRPTMNGLDFACIDEEERLFLEKEFVKEEVL